MGIEQQLQDVADIAAVLVGRMSELRTAPKELTKLQRKIQAARVRLAALDDAYKSAHAAALNKAADEARREVRQQVEQLAREEHAALSRPLAAERERLAERNKTLSLEVGALEAEADKLKEAKRLLDAYPDLGAIVECGNAAEFVAYKRAELAFIRSGLNAIDPDGKTSSTRIRTEARAEVEAMLRDAAERAERIFMAKVAASRPVTGEAPDS